MTNKELIRHFEKLVQEERRATRQVLEHIAEIESRRAYLDLGYEGMYSYLTQGLGYSEGAAYRRIQAARMLRAVPEVAKRIESGALNLTQLTEVAKVSHQCKQKPTAELFTRLESKNKSASEQIIAQTFDVKPLVAVRQRTQQDHSVRLELSFTPEQFATLEKARSLLSHICPDGRWPEVLTELARQYARKTEVKSRPAVEPKSKPSSRHASETTPATEITRAATSIQPTRLNSNRQPTTDPIAPTPLARRQRGIQPRPARRYISIHTQREIFARAGGRCEHEDPLTGRRCGSSYQPQIDHILPLASGGSNAPENLQLLCGKHNRAKGSG